jgi:hypothetical protein
MKRYGRDFLFSQTVQTGCGAQTVNRYRGSFPGINWPELEVNHSPSSIVEAQDEWSYTFAPFIRLHGVDRDD